MKKLFFLIVFFFTTALTFAQSEVWVNGYTRSNGTYVQGYYRTAPDYTINNNWSTVGNVNPHTGRAGTVSRSSSYSSTYYSAPAYTQSYYTTPTTYTTPSYTTTNTVYTGPRGGTYYINSNGNKTYISR
jgi:hypothetical protein